jgi:glycosyltransferase involved in cell wall biosynthesis
LKLVLLGDGQSPHLLKWARALAPRVDLWAASSRGFLPAFDDCLPAGRRLALDTHPRFAGGNLAVLKTLPRLVSWLKQVRPDWIHAHYLTSHGTLAWLATGWAGAPGRLAGSAWGSDILVTPERHALLRWLTGRVLRACALCTSDSAHMAGRMRQLGAGEVMTFPFGLEALPDAAPDAGRQPHLLFANRGLEPIYDPGRVLQLLTHLLPDWPDARLVVANDGSMRAELESEVGRAGLSAHVQFVGRLDPEAQAHWYRQASWYVSLPASDSVSVSVLEALAHGCIPILSDLPANHELVAHGRNGWVAADGRLPRAAELAPLAAQAPAIARANRDWVAEHALFAPAVDRFVERLRAIDAVTPAGTGRRP